MQKRVMLKMATACMVAVAGLVQAGTLYDWDFSAEADNTMFNQVLSSGTGSAISFSASVMSSNTVVSSNTLVISEQDGTVNGTDNNAFADIADLSSGTYWLVAEFGDWDISAGALDLAFSSAALGGQEIANVRFIGGSSVRARCFYNGSYEDIYFSSPEFPITFAVELNLDTDKTRFLYKVGTGEWTSTVEYDVKLTDPAAYLRFSASDMPFGEEMNLDRLYLTDVSPVPVYTGILYDWDFTDEADGTMLNDILSGGVAFSPSAMSSNAVVLSNTLVISEQGGSVNGTDNNAFADISDLSTGTYWMVTEFSDWDISAGALDLAFSKAAGGGQEIANVRFIGGSSVRARCFYNGSYEDIFFSSPEFPITFAVELNLDTDKTRFLYKSGTGEWASTVEYDAKLADPVTYLRFSASGMPLGEEMNLDRLYLTEISPVPESTNDSSSIVSIEPAGAFSMKLVVSASGVLTNYHLISSSNLVDGAWDYVAHSDTVDSGFAVSNLSYSVAEGSNVAVYIEASAPTLFYGISQ